ncbi:hypothetical protein BM613_09090 [Sulfoacidibacillus thermotolerans]|uniref:DhaL domain-containing protein n=2 Tax=Sulfoacidibacillus thermotolerans TaxID=1765684 RepID=A0A2U3D7Z5_SULT2|nr:hypothetical protein BM613_09090 [Sulfoacidibacillus thermotolerans]
MLHGGHQQLAKFKENVNALNVFPVPDGDTGTNMYLSFTSGIEQISRLPEGTSLERVVTAFSEGLLMGARGNSGVILSQLFRGFQLAFGKATHIDPHLFAQALQSGVQTAYKAVSRPVEGTILTVAREAAMAADVASKKANVTIEHVIIAAVERARQVLAKTPDLLPILRQAGVVDSGGQGLVYIYEGFLAALNEAYNARGDEWEHRLQQSELRKPVVFATNEVHGEGEFGYCTEFMIRIADQGEEEPILPRVRNAMSVLGDSLLVVQANDLVRVHVHTLHPGEALEAALTFGPLVQVKIDNMTEKNRSLMLVSDEQLEQEKKSGTVLAEPRSSDQQIHQPSKAEQKVCGLVVVAAGQGIVDLFESLGVDYIVPGGQTMNPSTEDLLAAASQVSASHVILLPNNRNIVMAAKQASVVSEGRIHVVETHSIGQGLGAALVFHPEHEVSANEAAMQDAISKIMSGSITTSVRDSVIGDHVIGEGDYIGMIDGEIASVNPSRTAVLTALIEQFCLRGAEICTAFYKDPAFISEVQATIMTLQAKYPLVEFEHQYGGQPVYDYLLAAE